MELATQPFLGVHIPAQGESVQPPREKTILLLCVKRNQSFKICLGKNIRSEGVWLFTLQSSCEKVACFIFAVIGEYKLCEMGEKWFVARTQLCAQGVFPDASLLLAQSFLLDEEGILSRGKAQNRKGGRSSEWMCRTGSEWDAHEVECKC